MAYTPEPTHLGFEHEQSAQLDREFWALFNNDLSLKDFIIGSIPIKAFNIIMDGAGVVGDDPNTPEPVIRHSYNIDTSVGVGGVVRDSLGTYQFKMRVPVLAGVNILEQTYPSISLFIPFAGVGLPNEITRAGPTRSSFDSQFKFTVVDVVNGIFQIETDHVYSTGGGALSVEATDLQPNDVFYAFGLLSLESNAGDFPDTP